MIKMELEIEIRCQKNLRCVKEEGDREQGACADIWCIIDGCVCPELMLGVKRKGEGGEE